TPRGTSQILLNGSPYPIGVTEANWIDTSITFDFPQKQTDGSNWRPGDTVHISVNVNGQDSANDVLFTIAVTHLVEIRPTAGHLPQDVVLLGTDFGQVQNGST